jgi:hypothetical protein
MKRYPHFVTWFAGEAGTAIDVLFGDFENPSGKLTTTFFQEVVMAPIYYSQQKYRKTIKIKKGNSRNSSPYR